MTKKQKTIGDALVEATGAGDHGRTQEAMKAFWGQAKKRGLPTPDDAPAIVAVRTGDRSELFEFPTRADAELFMDDVRRLYPKADTAIATKK
jgi:hypothetical protein